MWGLERTESSIETKDFFLKHNIKDILIPGIEMYFYDEEIAIRDFSPYGLIHCVEYFEPHKNDPTGSGIWFSKVICQKKTKRVVE